jgi:putative serine protease PepD
MTESAPSAREATPDTTAGSALPGRPPSGSRVRRTAVVIAAVVAVALAGGLAGGAIVRATEGTSRSGAAPAGCAATSVADTVLPSVVTITVQNGAAGGNGSDEIIRRGGYILTNDHVISPAVGGGQVGVVFTSGQTEPATIVGRAPAVDLAVVKVADTHGLPVIATGDVATLRVGQPVVALGAPLGLKGTVTSGIVSALGRDVPVPSGNGTTATLPGAIQTDASINPGNSGGALVDCGSRLVGINTAIATVPNAAGQAGGGSVGIGFAIPVDLAQQVAGQLIATGSFTPPYLGISTEALPPSVSRQSGLPGSLYVQAVDPHGPAAAAGLRPGDIITEVDGQPTTAPESLVSHTLRLAPNDRIRINYVRDGQERTTTATLATASGAGS